MGSFSTKLIYQMGTKESLQYDKPIHELNDKYLQTFMNGIRSLPNGAMMADQINNDLLDAKAAWVETDWKTGENVVVYDLPQTNLLLSQGPWAAALRNAGAAADTAMLVSAGYERGADQAETEWGLVAKGLSLYTGMGITNELDEVNRRRREKEKTAMRDEDLDKKDLTYTMKMRSLR
jgi:hypothetical protein